MRLLASTLSLIIGYPTLYFRVALLKETAFWSVSLGVSTISLKEQHDRGWFCIYFPCTAVSRCFWTNELRTFQLPRKEIFGVGPSLTFGVKLENVFAFHQSLHNYLDTLGDTSEIVKNISDRDRRDFKHPPPRLPGKITNIYGMGLDKPHALYLVG